MVLRRGDGERSGLEGVRNNAVSGLVAAGLVDLGNSWQRCRDRYRFDRGAKPLVSSLTAREIGEQREPFDEILATIHSELEFVHATLQGANFCASFSDMAGIILQYQADRNASADLELERAGTIWAEGVAGTNGVGTCVVEKRPTIVVGADHFFREYASLSCIAAPVLSADADMIGVLNLTTSNANVTGETLSLVAGLAIKTAERLSNQFFFNRFRDDTIMKIANNGQSILLALDQDQRIIGANQGARVCYGFDGDIRRDRDLWSIFERSPKIIDGVARAANLSGLRRLDNQGLCDAIIVRPQGRSPGTRSFKAASTPVPRARSGDGIARPRPDALTIEQCLGPDPRMQSFARLLRRVSGSSLPILLLGETGAGKDTLAKVIHEEGNRRLKPFVAVNCAAVPESLIDSELFGYGVGAFTGAKRDGNLGRLQQANGGTLFLDEIGDMPLSLQTRLLRVLESGEINPLGSAKTEHVDVSIIAATNNNVRKAVAEGRFRQDLYYRLAGVVVELQPLRERPDLAVVIRRLLDGDGTQPPARLTDEAMAVLLRHSWPGNVRELKFVLFRAQRVCDNGVITPEDLYLQDAVAVAAPAQAGDGLEAQDALQDAERKVIADTLALYGRDVTKAAQALSISRATLYRKIRLHQLGTQKAAN